MQMKVKKKKYELQMSTSASSWPLISFCGTAAAAGSVSADSANPRSLQIQQPRPLRKLDFAGFSFSFSCAQLWPRGSAAPLLHSRPSSRFKATCERENMTELDPGAAAAAAVAPLTCTGLSSPHNIL